MLELRRVHPIAPRSGAAALVLLLACGDDGRDTGLISATASASAGTTDTAGATGTTGASGTASGSTTDDAPLTTGDSATATATGSTGSTTTDASTSGGTSSSSGSDATSAGAKFDVGGMPDLGMFECVECGLTIASQQSGTLAILGQSVFATAELQGEIVYALGNAGPGRFIASADTSLPFNEQTDCPIISWLAGNNDPNPKLFWFGWGPQDGPKNWNYPGDSSFYHLPPQYVGNPAQLAADYDIVMYLEGSGQFDNGDQPTDQEMQTLYDFITVYGGGAYINSEFAGYMKAADYVSVNRVLVPLGVEALAVNLNWGNVNGQIDFACFPAPAE